MNLKPNWTKPQWQWQWLQCQCCTYLQHSIQTNTPPQSGANTVPYVAHANGTADDRSPSSRPWWRDPAKYILTVLYSLTVLHRSQSVQACFALKLKWVEHAVVVAEKTPQSKKRWQIQCTGTNKFSKPWADGSKSIQCHRVVQQLQRFLQGLAGLLLLGLFWNLGHCTPKM